MLQIVQLCLGEPAWVVFLGYSALLAGLFLVGLLGLRRAP